MKTTRPHSDDIGIILKVLWALRNEDQFYFTAYGKDMIETLLKKNLKNPK